MPGESPTRRDLLLAGSGIAAASALSGCLDLLSGGDGVEAPGYTDWFYDPDVVQGQNRYPFALFHLESLRENDDSLEDEQVQQAVEFVAEGVMEVGVDSAAVERAIFLGDDASTSVPAVYTGSIDADALATSLENEGFERAADHRGYGLYVAPDGALGFGVGSGTAVRTPGASEEAVQSVLEAVIDAKTGEGDRYVDADEHLNRLTASMPAALVVNGETHERHEETSTDPFNPRFAGQVANGDRIALEGDTLDLSVVRVFDEADSVDMDAIDEWVEAAKQDGQFARVEDVESSRDGRVVTVTGTADARLLFD